MRIWGRGQIVSYTPGNMVTFTKMRDIFSHNGSVHEKIQRVKRKDIFVNGYEKTYSEICADFEVKGLGVFAKEIVDKYNEIK